VLAACDSAGELAARGPDFGGAWVPVFSSAAARKASEVHWIAGLGETGVYCVVCPATAPYPQAHQRPSLTLLTCIHLAYVGFRSLIRVSSNSDASTCLTPLT